MRISTATTRGDWVCPRCCGADPPSARCHVAPVGGVPAATPAQVLRRSAWRSAGVPGSVVGLAKTTARSMVCNMATKQVTITIDEDLLAWFEQRAAAAGTKLSPTIARAARNWLLWEDAARLAEADRRGGQGGIEQAEAELAAQREAEDAEAGRGHAA